jgi:alkyl sulfatase BDS1-like metallo-beta-lactamase superfamily hydrolase
MNYVEAREVLLLARARIETCKSRWICYALETVALVDESKRATVEQLKGQILEQLGESCSLEGWLVSQGLTTYREVNSDSQEVRDKLTQTRLNWLDHMIEELR